jgi:hypothetical protein
MGILAWVIATGKNIALTDFLGVRDGQIAPVTDPTGRLEIGETLKAPVHQVMRSFR